MVTGRPWGRGQCRSRDSAFAAPAPLRRPSGCRSLLECRPKHGSLRPPQPLGSQHRHPQRRPLPRRHHRWDSGLCRDSTASLTQGMRSQPGQPDSGDAQPVPRPGAGPSRPLCRGRWSVRPHPGGTRSGRCIRVSVTCRTLCAQGALGPARTLHARPSPGNQRRCLHFGNEVVEPSPPSPAAGGREKGRHAPGPRQHSRLSVLEDSRSSDLLYLFVLEYF